MKSLLFPVCLVLVIFALACGAGMAVLRNTLGDDDDCFGDVSKVRHYEVSENFDALRQAARDEVHRLHGKEFESTNVSYSAQVYLNRGCLSASIDLKKDHTFGPLDTDEAPQLLPSKGKVGVKVESYDGTDDQEFQFLRGKLPVFPKQLD